MKKNISFAILITVLMFSVSDIYAQKSSPAKRVYITNLERKEGVSSETADKIRDIIKITMLEKPGNEYRIISDDDIKVMFKKAESLQAAGCDDESCSLNIAQAIKADEIIYGNVSRESGKIKVTAYNLETGTAVKQKGAGTKSMVNVSFDDKELEWMSREIGLKLIDPKYKITKAPVFNEKINITPIKITPVKKEDIAVIEFTSNETSFNAIVDYYKGIADEGDILFSKNEYEDALEKYIEIIKSIQKKLSDENQARIDPFTRSIEKRISSALIMEYKPEIEKIDRMILSVSNPNEKNYRKALEEYNEIEEDVRSEVKGINRDEAVRAPVQKIIDDRQDTVITAIIAIIEKRGDSNFRNYRFNDALNDYMSARSMASSLNSALLELNTGKALYKKNDLTLATGRSYLENIVNSYVDQAEYYNVTNGPDDAKKSMEKARKEITGSMRKFATEELMMKYNDYALLIPGAKQIDDDSKVKVKEAISRPDVDTDDTLNECIWYPVCTFAIGVPLYYWVFVLGM